MSDLHRDFWECLQSSLPVNSATDQELRSLLNQFKTGTREEYRSYHEELIYGHILPEGVSYRDLDPRSQFRTQILSSGLPGLDLRDEEWLAKFRSPLFFGRIASVLVNFFGVAPELLNSVSFVLMPSPKFGCYSIDAQNGGKSTIVFTQGVIGFLSWYLQIYWIDQFFPKLCRYMRLHTDDFEESMLLTNDAFQEYLRMSMLSVPVRFFREHFVLPGFEHYVMDHAPEEYLADLYSTFAFMALHELAHLNLSEPLNEQSIGDLPVPETLTPSKLEEFSADDLAVKMASKNSGWLSMGCAVLCKCLFLADADGRFSTGYPKYINRLYRLNSHASGRYDNVIRYCLKVIQANVLAGIHSIPMTSEWLVNDMLHQLAFLKNAWRTAYPEMNMSLLNSPFTDLLLGKREENRRSFNNEKAN